MQKNLARKLFLWWAVVSMISGMVFGCAGKTILPTMATQDEVPVTNSTATDTVIHGFTATTPPTDTPAPTVAASAKAPAEAKETPQKTPQSASRPPSGWTIYSNPDFVQGVALYGRQLWAATLGGVVVWDLDTGGSTLFTTRDGLVEIQGNDVVYCPVPEERILVAHSTGMLSAYDLNLKKWSRIPITFDDGSTLHGVQKLYCDAVNQRLMAGSADGLGILDLRTGRWRRVGPYDGLKVDSIRAIDVVGQSIWVAAGDKGAFMITGKTVFPFNGASGFPSGSVYDISVAPDQSIWFGYSTGLVHYIDKKWNSYGAQTPSGIPFQSVDQVEVGPDKRIWIASAEEGVCPFDPVKLFCSTVYPGTQGTPVTDLVVGPDNVAYAGTNGGGVLILDSNQVRHLKFDEQKLMSDDVLGMANSSDGMLWIATDRGVNVLDPGKAKETWGSITPQRDQLVFPRVTGILQAPNGMWFFYDQEAQASFYDGNAWLQLNSFKGLNGPVQDALVDQRGYVWFATAQGINVWDGTVMRSNSPADDSRSNVFHALFEQNGEIWAGSDHGLLHYLRYQWQVALPNIPINAIAQDNGSGLLLGTDQGLIRFDGNQSFLWVINLGDEVLINPKVTSIAWDGSGQLWVGTDGNGLLHYTNKRWEQYTTASGLPTDRVRKVIADRLGTIWIAAVTGEGGGALVRYVP